MDITFDFPRIFLPIINCRDRDKFSAGRHRVPFSVLKGISKDDISGGIIPRNEPQPGFCLIFNLIFNFNFFFKGKVAMAPKKSKMRLKVPYTPLVVSSAMLMMGGITTAVLQVRKNSGWKKSYCKSSS